MLPKVRFRAPSPALVVAFAALVVALGGTSYAAVTIGSLQIKNNSVRSKDIRNNDVRSGDVRNGSLLSKDFKAGQLPLVPAGPSGATGTRGATGPRGATGLRGATGDTGQPGSALAYARVDENGVLDTAHSKNVSSSARANNPPGVPVDGVYCLELSVVATNVVVSLPRVGGDPMGITSYAGLMNNGDSATTWCPTPTDKSVQVWTFSPSGLIKHPFYLVFN